jgi:hypothetical protein
MGPVLGRRQLALTPSRLLQPAALPRDHAAFALIEAAEIKLLRPLAGYTLRDHKYNDDIRSELGVQSITEILYIYRTNWHDHLLRMEPYRVPLQVYRYRPTDRRNVGRPKKRWKEQF